VDLLKAGMYVTCARAAAGTAAARLVCTSMRSGEGLRFPPTTMAAASHSALWGRRRPGVQGRMRVMHVAPGFCVLQMGGVTS
jgi:hypothetical protein